jgi:hypothetical protein
MILILKHGAICQRGEVSDTENPTLRSEISHVNGAPQSPRPQGIPRSWIFPFFFLALSPVSNSPMRHEISGLAHCRFWTADAQDDSPHL